VRVLKAPAPVGDLDALEPAAGGIR
jgi:hypothetical protein